MTVGLSLGGPGSIRVGWWQYTPLFPALRKFEFQAKSIPRNPIPKNQSRQTDRQTGKEKE